MPEEQMGLETNVVVAAAAACRCCCHCRARATSTRWCRFRVVMSDRSITRKGYTSKNNFFTGSTSVLFSVVSVSGWAIGGHGYSSRRLRISGTPWKQNGATINTDTGTDTGTDEYTDTGSGTGTGTDAGVSTSTGIGIDSATDTSMATCTDTNTWY